MGLAVGMGATCFNAPFDVVKSRFQVWAVHVRAAGVALLCGSTGYLRCHVCTCLTLLYAAAAAAAAAATDAALQSQLPGEQKYTGTLNCLATIYK